MNDYWNKQQKKCEEELRIFKFHGSKIGIIFLYRKGLQSLRKNRKDLCKL